MLSISLLKAEHASIIHWLGHSTENNECKKIYETTTTYAISQRAFTSLQ